MNALAGDGSIAFGRELRTRQLAALRVSEVEVPARQRLAPHAHVGAQVCFVLEGHYVESWPQGEQRLGPGSAFYRPSGLRHANRCGARAALALVVAFAPDGPSRHPSLPSRPVPLPLIHGLREEVRRELGRADDASAFALEGLALLLLGETARTAGGAEREPPWLRAALDVVERCHGEPLSLATVAAAVGVHRATLAAGFRHYRGVSVGEHIRAVRLRHAARLLSATRTPLAEIALTCGFADQSHLGRALRRAGGPTPGTLRRSGGTG
jgi:AraC-like DNA-binding protein/quercetin dioxygenase-like cupin family protein